jgi:hypothetical protein
VPPDRVEDRGHEQPDRDEDERVEEEHELVPERVAGDPDARPVGARLVAAEIQAGGDRGEHAGGAGELGGQVGEVRPEQHERDRGERVVEAPQHLDERPAEDQADRHARRGAQDEPQRGGASENLPVTTASTATV